MIRNQKDILSGVILLSLAIFWCAYVVQSIPAGTGGADVGPRAFPLLLGTLLGILALGFLVSRLFERRRLRAETEAPNELAAPREWPALAMIFFLLLAYGWAMQKTGFVLATAAVVALTMILILRDRSPVRITAMTFGLTFGCWLIFGQILDIPLATGTWISVG
ncbi:tripartite tricarboxylate transporter TctB family protein [Amorphus coralli]|uniref:tripartite tricarboxylate transporter TctB family protein n=1 Tax=Amorphus coralli TaxID=340680 RepID=UPI00035C8ACF|nr:tripartite tricarboxylate transporter TctB family protein [Amorphus coralli]